MKIIKFLFNYFYKFSYPAIPPTNKFVGFLAEIGELDNYPLDFDEADRLYGLESGYCCEDCSGDLREYKRIQYNYYYQRDFRKNVSKTFREYLYSQKTESAHRNFEEKLIRNYHD